MMRPNASFFTGILFLLVLGFASGPIKAQAQLNDWSFYSQRQEVEPKHWIENDFKRDGQNTLVIAGDKAGHDNGSWVKSYPVLGGSFIEFKNYYYSRNVDEPNRSILTTIVWMDSQGEPVGPKEFPSLVGVQEDGWALFQQTYQVPDNAHSIEVALVYRWDGDGKVFFAPPKIEKVKTMPQRLVKIAAVHHRPSQSTTEQNLLEFGDFAREAGQQGADIVCLPEGITLVGTQKNYMDAAESIPGPTTDYLGQIAKESGMYIVAGILERDGKAVFNTAILLDRDGQVAGKYRKVCLPREEIEGGVSPGQEFPVFETDFGKIGIMICWDVAFPEPARQLALQGAEIILLPIWGGNLNLAKARAIENQVYLVSSTYDMRTGIFDLEGNLMAEGTNESPVALVEVDLNQQKLWPWLGEYKNRIPQEMPGRKALGNPSLPDNR
ncbi:MAG: carbon-nitrogen hydrolase family protein [Saprospiraceae bacterium]|nr:carbon-nitrogen hydrolase family protein [Saprospiraceae bacterium]